MLSLYSKYLRKGQRQWIESFFNKQKILFKKTLARQWVVNISLGWPRNVSKKFQQAISSCNSYKNVCMFYWGSGWNIGCYKLAWFLCSFVTMLLDFFVEWVSLLNSWQDGLQNVLMLMYVDCFLYSLWKRFVTDVLSSNTVLYSQEDAAS